MNPNYPPSVYVFGGRKGRFTGHFNYSTKTDFLLIIKFNLDTVPLRWVQWLIDIIEVIEKHFQICQHNKSMSGD